MTKMRTLVFGLMVAVVACFATGCAAQAQCLRDNAQLHAQVDQDQHDLRDANGRLAVVSTEQAGTTLSSLASKTWEATMAGFGWAKKEAPIVYHGTVETYDATYEKLDKARKCYQDNGGNDAHTVEEYRAIATKCLGN
jgi:hypothetical protein